MTVAQLRGELAVLLGRALSQSLGTPVAPETLQTSFEIPREEKFGDLSSHAVMKTAKLARLAPRVLAEDTRKILCGFLETSPLAGRIERVEVEGPGFINFFFSEPQLAGVLAEIRGAADRFGRPSMPSRKILLEFVSANPTGPLTVAHGRQAALGDSLALILDFCGHRVWREYYNNDEGVQIDTLGRSTELRAREILEGRKAELPEDAYKGEYLVETAGQMLQQVGRDHYKELSSDEKLKRCRDFARQSILQGIQKDLADFGVRFDRYFSQETLMRSGSVETVLEEFRKKGFVYDKDGASWFQSTRWGDDKDRVLVKSDKTVTYLLPDIAYHKDKLERGFDLIVDILGPDHHGYIPRLKAAVQALGHPAAKLEVLIAQLVTLYEGKKVLRMSTRAGEFVTLRELLEEVGRDAGRFFFLMRKFDAHLDFDLELAKSQTPENPVFYIQYAHARVESIRRQCEQKGVAFLEENPPLGRLTEIQEKRILRLLSQFEGTVEAAARSLEPYRLVPYLLDLAGAFHKFYADHRVVGDDAGLSAARLALCAGVRQVIRTGLGLLGVSAPDKM